MRLCLRRLPLVLPALAVLAAAPAGAHAATPHCGGANLVPSAANGAQVRHATLCLLNVERRRRHLPRLRTQPALANAATAYAGLMVRERFFGHVSPAGTTMTIRIRNTSYLRSAHRWSLGENLAWGAGNGASPAQIVNAWMHSPPHRRNVLDRRFRHIGIGVADGAPTDAFSGAPATYVTEFGQRI
jgi:uncharacterized protein YkwD